MSGSRVGERTHLYTEPWLQGLQIAGEERSKVHLHCLAPGVALPVGLSPTPLSATTALVLKGGMWDCRSERAARRENKLQKNTSQTVRSFVSTKFSGGFDLAIATNSCPGFASQPFPWVLHLVGFCSLWKGNVSAWGVRLCRAFSTSVDIQTPENTHRTAKEH